MICSKCVTDKELSEFGKETRSRTGLRHWCKVCLSEYNKRYSKRPDQDYKKKIYRSQTKEHKNLYMKEYRKTQKFKNSRKLVRARQMLIPSKRITKNMAKSTWQTLKGAKAGRSWQSLVGYSAESLMQHLEAQFDENMNWDNYGSYWHVDHIRPSSSFNYTSTDDQEFIDCWSLDNLQPLEARENMMKSDKLNWQNSRAESNVR